MRCERLAMLGMYRTLEGSNCTSEMLPYFVYQQRYTVLLLLSSIQYYHQSHECGGHVWPGLRCASVSFLYSLCWNKTQEMGEWISSMKGKKCYNLLSLLLLLLLLLKLQQEFISSWLVWVNVWLEIFTCLIQNYILKFDYHFILRQIHTRFVIV